MNHDAYPDSYIREILNGVKSIAMVGARNASARAPMAACTGNARTMAERMKNWFQGNF